MSHVVITSLFWKFLERVGTQIIQFIIQIILARLILPSEYGVISILTIFISITTVFIESGFSTAILQKKDVNELDYNTSFVTSSLIAVCMYIILFLAAPFIASFYQIDILCKVIRISSVILIIGAYNSVQITKVSKEMNFKRLFHYSLISVIVSGLLGIASAYYGLGVWALVIQQISQKAVLGVVMTFSLRWIPKLQFSNDSFQNLFSFGSKLLISNLINTVYNNIYGLVIGRIYNSECLGYYNRADQFPSMIVNNVNGSLQSVMLPVLSSKQDVLEDVKNTMRKTIKLSCYFIFPLMFGLLACSDLVVELFLTEKWLPCVPFMQLLCISYSFYPLHTVNLQTINALGRSDIFLKLEVIKKTIGIFVLCISFTLGIYYMVASQAFISILSSFINAKPNKQLLNYSFREQIKDIFPAFLSASVMSLAIILVNLTIDGFIYIKLPFDIAMGIVIYLSMSKLLKINEFNQILLFAQEVIKNGK